MGRVGCPLVRNPCTPSPPWNQVSDPSPVLKAPRGLDARDQMRQGMCQVILERGLASLPSDPPADIRLTPTDTLPGPSPPLEWKNPDFPKPGPLDPPFPPCQ